jgi:phage shock protein A
VARRIATLFRIKANKVLDRADDPREVLDYSYERQVEMRAKVRRGVADVATSRKRLELQAGQLQASPSVASTAGGHLLRSMLEDQGGCQ